MQTAGRRYPYSNTASSTYDDYQASDYGSSPRKDGKNETDWQIAHATHDSLDYDSRQMDGHANGPGRHSPTNAGMLDDVSLHLLYETAMFECQSYHILGMSEVDELKKERTRLSSRLDAANRKLLLENKVKDAAQNIHRLYSAGVRNRPDTPQSPASPQRSRGSLLGSRSRGDSGANGAEGQAGNKAQDELTVSIKKVDELNETIKAMQEQLGEIDRRLLGHTAAVLAEQTQRANRDADVRLSRRASAIAKDNNSVYSSDEFDGIRDILRGRSKQPVVPQQSEQQLETVHANLERLNDQLRQVIDEASKARGAHPPPELRSHNIGSNNIASQIEETISRLQQNVLFLDQEQQRTSQESNNTRGAADTSAQQAAEYQQRIAEYEHESQLNAQKISQYEHDLQENAHKIDEYEHRLQETAGQMDEYEHKLQATSRQIDEYEHKLQETSHQIDDYEQKLQENAQNIDDHKRQLQELQRTSQGGQKLDEYEATVGGLWEIVRLDGGAPSPGGALSSPTQGFSLPAFSARVQHLFDRAQSANEQQDILRRQIQQQRDLNGRSDVEKDGHIAELQNRNDELQRGHSDLQQQLTSLVEKHAQSEHEATQYQAELEKIMAESESLQSTIDAKQKERDQMASQLHSFKQNVQAAESLESEVVRLTTELAMAKAELDGAYGTRAQRKKEAEAANGDRTKALEQELQEMATEFQELTRESVEMEKEREQLDALIDSLRERCEQLELQLSEEKAHSIGGNSAAATDANGRENTSVAVMRQEFKKIMRESKTEGLKALKVEQEERRRLEIELRRLRSANNVSLAARNGSRSASTASAAA